MRVQISEELRETMEVRVYNIVLSNLFEDLVITGFQSRPCDAVVEGSLALLCELVRQTSLGRFHKVELRPDGLTCFIAGRNSNFDGIDTQVARAIESFIDESVELVKMSQSSEQHPSDAMIAHSPHHPD